MPDPRRVYRSLVRLHPARFREEYAGALERQFRDEYREQQGRGRRALFCLRAIIDIAASIPAEFAHEAWQDIRHAAKAYRARRLVVSLVVVALGLAIGAATGVFSILNSLLFRPLPFPDEALVTFRNPPVDAQDGRTAFEDWRAQSGCLSRAAAYFTWGMNLTLPEGSARARVSETSASFFSTLAIDPALGRAFSPEEDQPGRGDVAVIGYGLWEQLFARDPRALGAAIRLNGVPLTVIGIAPPGFDYPARTAIWTPTAFDWKRLPKSEWLGAGVIGRLQPGLSMTQAAAMFHFDARRRVPRAFDGNERHRPRLLPIRDDLSGDHERASLVLMGAVAFVLVIACANVAYLLFSRTAERRPEWMIRAALGASRARLTQQLVTEGLLLTLTSAAAGLMVAHWISRIASLARPTQISALVQAVKLSPTYTIWDWRVLAFAIATALAAGIVIGALPALVMRRALQDVVRLQPGARAWSGGRVRSLLIATQAVLTMVLLAGSLSLGRTFLRLSAVDLRLQVDRAVSLNVSLQGTRLATDSARRQYYSAALERLRGLPGVVAAGAVQSLPLMLNTGVAKTAFQLDSGNRVEGSFVPVTPGYFRAIGTGMVEGREFTAEDSRRSEPVAIVNEELARLSGVRAGMTGRKLFCFLGRKQYTIIGVARTQRLGGPSISGVPTLYTQVDQQPPASLSFVVRTAGGPEPYLSLCRSALQDVDRQIPVYDVRTMEGRLDDLLAGARLNTTAVLFFAALATVLAVIGIYSVAAHSIAQRTHEIGVRIAIGAEPGQVRLLVLRQSVAPVAAGIVAGMAVSRGLDRWLQSLIDRAQPAGPWTCAAAAAILIATAATAVWTASRRVTRIDPVHALRAE